MKRLHRTCCRPGKVGSFFSQLLRPVGEHPAFFLFAAIVPTFPDILYAVSQEEMTFFIGRNLVLALLLSLFRGYVLTLPLCLPRCGGTARGFSARRVIRTVYGTAVLLILGVASYAESFLQLRFGALCSASVIQVLWETNPRRAANSSKPTARRRASSC